MARFTKQHYVPKFYLKNFCQPDGTIYCYDKLRDKSFKSNLNNIAHENFFYDIPELAPATVENSMAQKERIFSKVLKYIIQRKSLEGIRPDTKEVFFLFIATQMVRTNEFRNEVKDGYERLANIMAKDRGIKIPEHLKIYITDDSAKKLHLKMLLNPDVVFSFARSLRSRKWVILENNTGEPLWCSDHPIAFFNFFSYPGNMGILSPGVDIHFPISDRLCLTSYDPTMTRMRTDQMLRLNVVFNNELQTESSHQFVYSKNNDFSTAKRYLDANPESKNPHRSRSVLKSDPRKIEFLKSRRWTPA